MCVCVCVCSKRRQNQMKQDVRQGTHKFLQLTELLDLVNS